MQEMTPFEKRYMTSKLKTLHDPEVDGLLDELEKAENDLDYLEQAFFITRLARLRRES